MLTKLQKYLNGYSQEIDEQLQPEHDENLRDLWKKNAELAIKICGILNIRYLSLHRIEDIPEEHRGSYSSRAKCAFDAMEAIIPAEQFFSKDCPSETVATRDYSLDVLKAILSENYRPPEEIEDTLKHLLTLHFFYAYLMPTTPGLSHVIPLRAGYALTLLIGSALIKSYVADDKGRKEDQRVDQKKSDDKKAADMLGLISQVRDGLTINRYRTTDGKIKLYSMATEIEKCFRQDEKIKKRLGEISKRYKNGTKIPTPNTIVNYLKKIDL